MNLSSSFFVSVGFGIGITIFALFLLSLGYAKSCDLVLEFWLTRHYTYTVACSNSVCVWAVTNAQRSG